MVIVGVFLLLGLEVRLSITDKAYLRLLGFVLRNPIHLFCLFVSFVVVVVVVVCFGVLFITRIVPIRQCIVLFICCTRQAN